MEGMTKARKAFIIGFAMLMPFIGSLHSVAF